MEEKPSVVFPPGLKELVWSCDPSGHVTRLICNLSVKQLCFFPSVFIVLVCIDVLNIVALLLLLW